MGAKRSKSRMPQITLPGLVDPHDLLADRQFSMNLARGMEVLRAFTPADPMLGNRETVGPHGPAQAHGFAPDLHADAARLPEPRRGTAEVPPRPGRAVAGPSAPGEHAPAPGRASADGAACAQHGLLRQPGHARSRQRGVRRNHPGRFGQRPPPRHRQHAAPDGGSHRPRADPGLSARRALGDPELPQGARQGTLRAAPCAVGGRPEALRRGGLLPLARRLEEGLARGGRSGAAAFARDAAMP